MLDKSPLERITDPRGCEEDLPQFKTTWIFLLEIARTNGHRYLFDAFILAHLLTTSIAMFKIIVRTENLPEISLPTKDSVAARNLTASIPIESWSPQTKPAQTTRTSFTSLGCSILRGSVYWDSTNAYKTTAMNNLRTLCDEKYMATKRGVCSCDWAPNLSVLPYFPRFAVTRGLRTVTQNMLIDLPFKFLHEGYEPAPSINLKLGHSMEELTCHPRDCLSAPIMTQWRFPNVPLRIRKYLFQTNLLLTTCNLSS